MSLNIATNGEIVQKQGVQQAGGVCIAETLDKAERAEGEQKWTRPKGQGHGPVQDLKRVNRTGPIFLGFANHFNSILVPLGQRRYSLLPFLSSFIFYQMLFKNKSHKNTHI
jgi:hypothetical protein